MGNILHPDGSVIVNPGIAVNQFPAHNSHISSAGYMGGGIRQPAAVLKIGAGHSKPLRALVHHPHELRFASRYIFRHSHRGIISGSYYDAFNQRFYGLNLSLLQKYLGSSHGFGVGAGYNGIRHLNFPALQGIKNQDQGHDLGNAGRTSFFISVVFINYLTCRSLH